MTVLSDAPARAAAINPLASFCVSAPAGSGKTELLIQRYLGLLSRVRRPEQVLAITFTRKAAAQMRDRVVQALHAASGNAPCASPHEHTTRALAQQALAADAQGNWNLLRDTSRFNIRTIDSFCAALARQMPVLSQIGGQPTAQDDVAPLYSEALLELYSLLDEAHPVATDLAALLLHFDNNWDRLHELLTSMLACREQWRHYIGIHHAPAESEAYLIATVEALVGDALQQTAVLLAPHVPQLLDLFRYSAGNLSMALPGQFPGTASGDLGGWHDMVKLLLTATGEWRKLATAREGFPGGKGEPEQRKKQWKALMVELQAIDGLHERLKSIRSLPAVGPDSVSWRMAVHLSRLLPTLAAQLLLVFRKYGVVDHSQVAQAALLALGDDDDPTELSLRMDYQIEHILVDEFQDTAITQYELLQKLTRGWGDHNLLHPQSPRTLMIVGDAMQSIYGFRGANVGLFLRARLDGFNGVALRHLALDANFRSDAGVVGWVNHAFLRAFPARDDACRSQVSYSAAIAVRPSGCEIPVEAHAFIGDAAREQEVGFVCDAIASGLRSHDGSIAVLGRSRGHLQPIIRRLRQLQIPCNAPELDSLAASPIVADLLTLCRALANEYDRLAWAALLRAPWCALDLADLFAVVGAAHETSVWTNLRDSAVNAQLSADGRHRVQRLLDALDWARRKRDRLALRVWIEQTWLRLEGPACASDREGLRDAESFLQLLEEADATGAGLDLTWLQAQVRRRFMASGDPDCRLQLLTLHKAKGLEFDQVFIVQLDRLPRQDDREVLLWDEHNNASGERAFLLAADDHSGARAPTLYNYLLRQRRDKGLLENTRLLYVGATRAISRLVLTARVAEHPGALRHRDPPEQSLLRCIWPTFQAQMQVHETPIVGATGGAGHTFPPLIRLCSAVPAGTAAGATVESPRVAGIAADGRYDHTQRSIGTVVHLALEEISRRAVLPESTSAADEQRWRIALQRLGVWGKALAQALPKVRTAVSQCLQPQGSGRWVLSPGHAAAYSEWALTTVDAQGVVRDIIIDRSFIDLATGERWVIDYKTGQPAGGEGLDAFAARQCAAHRDQLRLYRDAVRAVEIAPLRCALFFTALGVLHHVPELDLPSLETAATP